MICLLLIQSTGPSHWIKRVEENSPPPLQQLCTPECALHRLRTPELGMYGIMQTNPFILETQKPRPEKPSELRKITQPARVRTGTGIPALHLPWLGVLSLADPSRDGAQNLADFPFCNHFWLYYPWACLKSPWSYFCFQCRAPKQEPEATGTEEEGTTKVLFLFPLRSMTSFLLREAEALQLRREI